MAQLVDFAPEGEPYLCAYDVELKEWGGRTLRTWAECEPTGEWIEIRKPETPEEMEARRMREHACEMNRDMMGTCFVCGSSSLPNAKAQTPPDSGTKNL